METPVMASKKRKTLGSAALESPNGVINHMRRSSLVTSTPVFLQANDDEAERRNWKRMSVLPENEVQPSPSIPLNTLEEFMGIWVKMSVENKINTKNVWKIHIIDYLRTLLDKNTENPIQMATASLGASAKVYGLRVDDVYTEVVKLSGGLGRGGATAGDEEHAEASGDDGNQAANGDSSVVNRARVKKKKKGKKKTTVNPETLVGDVDILDTDHPLFAELNARSGDIISTDNMFQVFVPINSNTCEYDIRIHEKLFDQSAPKRTNPNGMEVDEDVTTIKLPFTLQSPNEISDFKLCSTFAEFSLTNWSPENENEQNSQQNQSIVLPPIGEQINLAFDMNEEPEAIVDVSMASIGENGQNYSSDEEIVQEANTEPNLPAFLTAGCKPRIENIEDMRPSNPDTTRHLEYSYNLISSGIWAGPSHWKIKSIIHRSQPRISSHIRVEAEVKKKRKTKTNLLKVDLSYSDLNQDESIANNKPYLKCVENKLKLATITSWNKNKNLLPLNLHVTVADCLKLVLNSKRTLIPEERPASNLSIENDQYDYNNLNDSTFCNPPNPELTEADADNRSDHEFPANDFDQDDVFDGMEHEEPLQTEEGDILTGDNLLSAPRVIPKVFVPYATRAKKVNMKVIKKAMWNVITGDADVDINSENVNNTNIMNSEEKEAKETKFSTIIEKIPKILPRDQAANMSIALAFFGLLHLANENSLKLQGMDDLSDVTINKG